MSSDPAASLIPGSVFAREYRIVRPLAQGGMGAVYVALQLGTQKERALKVMQPSLVRDPRSRERFLYEARASAALETDHVVEVVGAGVDDATGAPWIAMELLRGETLAATIERIHRLSPRDVRECLDQLRHALGAAHAVGLVHRDLKPENLFLASPRRADVHFTLKVLDFGIAKTLDASDVASSTSSSLGSPLWMAPEQANAQPISTATDVWPIGLLAYWMLTGRYYWNAAYGAGVTVAAVLTEILIAPLEAPSQRAARAGVATLLPPGFDEWFAGCIARDPGSRYPDGAKAIAALLERLDRWLGASASPMSLPPNTPAWFAATAAPASFGATPLSFGGAPALPATASVRAAPQRWKRYALAGAIGGVISVAGGLLIANAMRDDEPDTAPTVTSPFVNPSPMPVPSANQAAQTPAVIVPPAAPSIVAPAPLLAPAAPTAPSIVAPTAPTHPTPRTARTITPHMPTLAPTSATSAPLTPTTATVATTRSGTRPPITHNTAAIASMLDSADRVEAGGNHSAAESIRGSAWSYLHGVEQQADNMATSDPSSAAMLRSSAAEVRAYLTQRLGRSHP